MLRGIKPPAEIVYMYRRYLVTSVNGGLSFELRLPIFSGDSFFGDKADRGKLETFSTYKLARKFIDELIGSPNSKNWDPR